MSYQGAEYESYMGIISNLISKKDIEGLKNFLERHIDLEDLRENEREYAENKLKELEDELSKENLNSSDRDER